MKLHIILIILDGLLMVLNAYMYYDNSEWHKNLHSISCRVSDMHIENRSMYDALRQYHKDLDERSDAIEHFLDNADDILKRVGK